MTIRKLAVLASLIAVTACSSEKTTELTISKFIRGVAKAKITKVIPKKKATPKPGQVLNRQMINDSKFEIVLAKIDKLGVVNILQKTAQNRTRKTYRSPAGFSITLDQGLITATRGLGFDLMAQGTDISVKSMFSNRKNREPYKRRFRYLNTDNKLETSLFICLMSYQRQETINIVGRNHTTGKYLEKCQSETTHFENQYWVDRNRVTIWKSTQRIHPALGTITLQKLN